MQQQDYKKGPVLTMYWSIALSPQNHRIAWVEKDLKDYLGTISLLRAAKDTSH